MKKSFVAVLCLAALSLAACQKNADTGAAQDAPAATPSTSSTVDASLPKVCLEYLDKVTACANKVGAGGDALKQGLDETKKAWAALTDKSALENACKTANDGFQQTASAMKC